MSYEGKHAVIVGLARTGLAAAEYLAHEGARVTLNDRKPESELPAEDTARARALGAALELGGHPDALFASADLVVLSPGVPRSLSVIQGAIARGVPVLGDMEIAFRVMRGHVCAITGSNGKTTTTALTGSIFSGAGLTTVIAGNIGTPILSRMESDRPDTWFVCELSSFQLESIDQFRPRIAAILNLTPDHLDRYDSFVAYADAKLRVGRRQGPEDRLLLNAYDPLLARETTLARIHYFSRQRVLDRGCYLAEGQIYIAEDDGRHLLMPAERVPLKGAHNIENVMAAALMGRAAGVAIESIRRSVEEFQAVAHRLQFVSTVRGVEFYNDSKATNVDATIKAIESFPGNLILILGGRDKGGSYAPLRSLCTGRVKLALLIGEAAGKILSELSGACRIETATSLEEAVQRGFEHASPGDTVLLAPACSSFDMFRDYEHRGEMFTRAVIDLKGKVG